MNLRASGDAEGVLALAAPPPSPSCACATSTRNTASTRAHMILTHIFPPLTSARKDRIFKPSFFMAGAIAQDWQSCQFLFCLMLYQSDYDIPVLLDEKSTVVPVRLPGEQSGSKRKVSYGDARSNSASGAVGLVGKRFSAIR